LSHSKPKARPSKTAARIEKREKNTAAARRYRERRVHELTSLKAELMKVQAERDDLRVRLAKLEGEVVVLRRLRVSGG